MDQYPFSSGHSSYAFEDAGYGHVQFSQSDDPMHLDPHNNPYASFRHHWDPSYPLGGYIDGNDATILSSTNHMPSYRTGSPLFLSDGGITPFPTGRRYGSPASQHPSSCSSVRSPNTDSEHFPTTPPDYSISPRATRLEIQYAGPSSAEELAAGLGMACVDPQQVNPANTHLGSGRDDAVPPFDCPPRTFSLSSDDSASYEVEAGASMQPLGFIPRQTTPDEDSIMLDGMRGRHVYPDPDDLDGEDTVSPSRGADDDSDYHPKRTNRRSQPTPKRGRSDRSRPQRAPAERTSKRQRNSRDRDHHASLAMSLPDEAEIDGEGESFGCQNCDEEFEDMTALEEHVRAAHRRPYICVFNYAGCVSTFSTKNEWKRHVLRQHLMLQFWVCTEDSCTKDNAATGGQTFNRKDLYTQHVRRLHIPPSFANSKKKKSTPEWDEHLRVLQGSAQRDRCRLPTYMKCPAKRCNAEFHTSSAWDDRMEHVAKHLDRASLGEESPVVFGGDEDKTLTKWATSPEVNIVGRNPYTNQWELRSPLLVARVASGGEADD